MTRVLVVDDEKACRDSLHLLLTTCTDFEVETAADAPAAVEASRRFRPDVLIVDWLLGGATDGLEVARAVRAVNPRVRTILITGFPSEELDARIEAVPAAEYLAKPFRPGELIAATKRAAG